MAGGLRYESMADMPPRMRQQVAGKVMAACKAVPVAGAAVKKAPKYHNIKTEVNGIRFDSKKEANRYLALIDAARAALSMICVYSRILRCKRHTQRRQGSGFRLSGIGRILPTVWRGRYMKYHAVCPLRIWTFGIRRGKYPAKVRG